MFQVLELSVRFADSTRIPFRERNDAYGGSLEEGGYVIAGIVSAVYCLHSIEPLTFSEIYSGLR